MKRAGKVYLVGAGPGDPGLITVRGKALLEKAEVVVYDYLANPKLLAHAPKEAEFVYVGKKGGAKHNHTQDEINALLVEKVAEGKTVVRLKGGDPFIFGRGGEELEVMHDQGLPFEVVPGVTSATAAATYAGIPITHRGHTATVAFLTGHEDPAKPQSNIDWEKLATGAGTLVVYMGIKNLPVIVEKMLAFGRAPETPVAVVRWASTPQQQSVTGTLENIAQVVQDAGIKAPALIVVGDVVTLRDKLDWFEQRPLFHKRILVTRTRSQASALTAGLEEQGADCLECSTINIQPMESYAQLDGELERLSEYHWVLFTSINGVKYFFERLHAKGMDSRDLKGPAFACVGKTTADLLFQYGICADLIPSTFTGEGLAKSLLDQGVEGRNILIPRAKKGREFLPETLRGAGAQVVVVPVYLNVPEESQAAVVREELSRDALDMLTFTSSSTVTNFVSMLGTESREALQQLLAGVKIAAIGPITAKTVVDSGLTVDVEAKEHSIAGLIDAIVEYYRRAD